MLETQCYAKGLAGLSRACLYFVPLDTRVLSVHFSSSAGNIRMPLRKIASFAHETRLRLRLRA